MKGGEHRLLTAQGFQPGIRKFDYVVFVHVLGREAASLRFDHISAKNANL